MSPIFHATRLLNSPILGMSKGNAQFRTHIRHLDGDHQMQSSSENNHFLAIGRPLVSGSFQRTVCLVARNKLRRNSSPGGTNKKSWLVHSCSACLRCQYRNDHTANMAVCVPRFQMAVCVLPALWSARLLWTWNEIDGIVESMSAIGVRAVFLFAAATRT